MGQNFVMGLVPRNRTRNFQVSRYFITFHRNNQLNTESTSLSHTHTHWHAHTCGKIWYSKPMLLERYNITVNQLKISFLIKAVFCQKKLCFSFFLKVSANLFKLQVTLKIIRHLFILSHIFAHFLSYLHMISTFAGFINFLLIFLPFSCNIKCILMYFHCLSVRQLYFPYFLRRKIFHWKFW